jgi:pimeloyl-[acyl-carrier protein] methyl ester esterase
MEGGISRRELEAFRRAFARDPEVAYQHFLRLQLQGEPAPRNAHRQLLDLLGSTSGADITTLTAGLDQLAELDNGDRLANPPCPLWRIAGEGDPMLATALRDSADLRLPDSGHCPMLSQPNLLARSLAELVLDAVESNDTASVAGSTP